MPYRLQDGLSYCHVGGHVVFLDVPNDRYFRLPEAMERRFTAYIEGRDDARVDIDDLADRNILTDAPIDPRPELAPPFVPPARSALEQERLEERISIADSFDVLRIVISTRIELRARGLETTLDRTTAYRQKMSTSSMPAAIWLREDQLLHASGVLRRVRLKVPIPTRCLLDSLAMVRFLAKRGLHANIVFGVTANPFSAHCWAQSGELVLTDTVGHVNAHTPIRVV